MARDKMRVLNFLFLFTCLAAEDVADSSFSVRLTPEEEAASKQKSCCPPVRNTCPAPCCKPPSLNCPPVMPPCDRCDCILDYYNPLVFNGWDLSVEWLFWTVQQKSSTFAITPHHISQPFPPASTVLSDTIGKYRSADFGWNSGVRAAVSHTFERDAWGLMGQYTFYKASNSNSVHRSQNIFLYLESPNREIIQSNMGPNEIKSDIYLHYQVGDFLLSRRFLPGCQILFNFFAGPTGAWIQEEWSIKSIDTGAIPQVTTQIRNHWSFGGGGMRLGCDANWHMGSGFGLFNKVSFATLVGAYSNHKRTDVVATGGSSSTVSNLLTPNICNVKEEEVWVVPETQLAFGMNWNHRFCTWSMSLQGAFEIQTWYDLHQYHQDAPTTSATNVNKIDYRNASPMSLWGMSWRINFSF